MSHPWRPFLTWPPLSDLVSKLLSCFPVSSSCISRLLTEKPAPCGHRLSYYTCLELLIGRWSMSQCLEEWWMNYPATGPLCHQKTLSLLVFPSDTWSNEDDTWLRNKGFDDQGDGSMTKVFAAQTWQSELHLKNLNEKSTYRGWGGRDRQTPETHWLLSLYNPGASGQWDALL